MFFPGGVLDHRLNAEGLLGRQHQLNAQEGLSYVQAGLLVGRHLQLFRLFKLQGVVFDLFVVDHVVKDQSLIAVGEALEIEELYKLACLLLLVIHKTIIRLQVIQPWL